MDIVMTAALVLLISIVVMLLLGVPISVSIGLGSTLALIVVLGFDGASVTASQRVFSGMNSFSLLAIAFFILAGNIMNKGGIAIRLVNCAKVLGGKLPGPLLQSNVLANMMFGAISGSGVAAAAAVGGTMSDIQDKEGYDKNLCAAVNIASAPTGMLIPPSNTLIVYSTAAGSVSVSALFMAGYIPGIMWGIGVMILAGIMSKRLGYVNKEKLTLKIALITLWQAIPSLLLIIIVIGGILRGVFTATEGSAIAVVYSLIISLIYRSLNVKELPQILIDSAKMTSIVILMIGVSSIMSWVLAYTKLPLLISDSLLGITDSFIVILLIMNIILLVVGTFMDPTPAVLIFTPIFLPIVMGFGMSPIHFGIMIVFNLCVGTITPPVGPILFTGCKVAGVRIEDVIKSLLPFFAVAIVILFLVTYVEWFTMFIPQQLDLVK